MALPLEKTAKVTLAEVAPEMVLLTVLPDAAVPPCTVWFRVTAPLAATASLMVLLVPFTSRA